jgi:hypothetical protein
MCLIIVANIEIKSFRRCGLCLKVSPQIVLKTNYSNEGLNTMANIKIK